MLRRSFRARRFYHLLLRHPRRLSSSSKSSVEPPNSLQNPRPAPSVHPPQILQRSLSHSTSAGSSQYLTRNSALALSAAVAVASYAILSNYGYDRNPNSSALYTSIENAVHQSNESVKRIVHHARQTGVAASVLWQSLRSVLSSANHEMRTGFELRVASLLADIASANAGRREALVRAGGGAVVDWLLETVAVAPEGCGTQAEAARALAYLLADPDVRPDVLGRPGAVPNLLKFIFLCQPQNQSKKHSRRSSFNVSDSLKGRSMLVTAIMDIVTSNSDSLEKVLLKPLLPANAETRDIAAAIQVIEEGGLHLENPERSQDDEDGGRGMKGIGIKIIEGTAALGLARENALMEAPAPAPVDTDRNTARTLAFLNKRDSSLAQANLSSSVVPGVWDDLHSQHVAVPFAAWALANWAMASEINRSNIRDLDKDGGAVMTALLAPERSVKWHGCLVARLLLEDRNLPLNTSISDWASTLLSTLSQASKTDDISLVQMALSAFLVSVERSPGAQKVVMEKGLHLMRDVTKRTSAHQKVQESLAKSLELLSTGDLRLSLEESQRWSGILLSWIFGKAYSVPIHSSAMRILSCILEDYGPYSVPVSQGWLALLLNVVVSSSKTSSSTKASAPPKGDDKLRTQIDQSAAQIANQLAVSVVNLAGNQLGTAINSQDSFPLADLLSLEPFAGSYKNFKKDNPPKFDVADAASAALKGIKSLAEISAEDVLCRNKITDFGVLCLLRRFLLRDDYEKLAAFEAYDASRTHEAQERVPNNADESSNTNGPSSLRVPDTAHIRRHATRLLAILSLLPKVKKLIMEDETWCRWLEDCAAGKIPGCNDLKIRSYARATLLNVLCDQQSAKSSSNGGPGYTTGAKRANNCPHYGDSIFLINPELSHWKCPESQDQSDTQEEVFPPKEANLTDSKNTPNVDDSSITAENSSSSKLPSLDIVFVHGLRGGPFKTWRLSDDKTSTKSGLVEKIDEEAGKLGTFWPGEWLPADFPEARIFSLKYKTNLTQWSGASLPLQEVSSMLLNKLVAAGIGNRPVVFVTHSLGGLVVKQMLFKAKTENIDNLVMNTVGVVFYSCPHFGSKLADMPWRMGLVLRPAPTIGELRSGSPKLIELNDFLRHLHKKGMVEVLSFCETQVTPIVEGYGGWAFRMEIVPIESAYPGFGELVVLESTDHINSCKPLDRADLSYAETVEFLRKLKTSQHVKE